MNQQEIFKKLDYFRLRYGYWQDQQRHVAKWIDENFQPKQNADPLMDTSKKRNEAIHYFAKTLAHKSLEENVIIKNINWLLNQLNKYQLITYDSKADERKKIAAILYGQMISQFNHLAWSDKMTMQSAAKRATELADILLENLNDKGNGN